MTKPRPCARCGVKPVAYIGREYCYDCVPRVWKKPPRCKRCGSNTDYYTNHLCRRCHRNAPLTESCRDCLAWGITRSHGGLCQACRGWNRRFPHPQECPSCRRVVTVNARGFCRLCCRQAHLVRAAHHSSDVCQANRDGQQLFIADLFRDKRPQPRAAAPAPTASPRRYPVGHRQLALFDVVRDYTAVRPSELTLPLPDLAAALDQVLVEHAARHGWRTGLQANTRSALRMLLATQDTPGTPITARDAAAVTTSRKLDNLKSVLDILATAGILEDDRRPALDAYVDRHAETLADAMATEFRQWYQILRDGTTTPPRYRPRKLRTVQMHIYRAVPVLHAWTEADFHSLREIDRQDVIDILPAQPHQRRQTLAALRALFRFLKGRHMVFVNPTARLTIAPIPAGQPLPVDLAPLCAAVNSTAPAQGALATLIAFHALRVNELCALLLTDIRDGRLHLNGRAILLADPVRAKLARWLDERARRWPNTTNPHLFINLHSAVRTTPVNPVWISQTIGISAQAIREDRILLEAITTAGDIRRLCDLFGLTIGGAERYLHTTDQPDNPVSC